MSHRFLVLYLNLFKFYWEQSLIMGVDKINDGLIKFSIAKAYLVECKEELLPLLLTLISCQNNKQKI